MDDCALEQVRNAEQGAFIHQIWVIWLFQEQTTATE